MRTSEQLFQRLHSSIKTARGKDCLQHIKDVCNMLERNNVKITPASVGRECEIKWGWPRAPSIRNSKDVHMAYIKLRQAEQGLGQKVVTKKSPSISDPTAIALIRVLEEKVRTSERRFNLLKRLIYDLSPIDVDRIEAELASGGVGSVNLRSIHQSNLQEFDQSLKEVAASLLDDNHLNNFGLELYNDNICQKKLHRIFLKKSCVVALREIIKKSSSRHSSTKSHSLIRSVKE